MAATVSVSWPIRTARRRASGRWRQGISSGTGVWRMAAQAAWRAVTTYPLGVKRVGGPSSASRIRSAQKPRRSAGRRGSPTSRSSRASLTARSTATVHSRQASSARGSVWVRAEMRRAATATASGSPRWARATGPVRIRLPFPAERSGW